MLAASVVVTEMARGSVKDWRKWYEVGGPNCKLRIQHFSMDLDANVMPKKSVEGKIYFWYVPLDNIVMFVLGMYIDEEQK